MTKSLRRRHLQVWTALSLLLPAGICIAWLVIPVQQPVNLINEKKINILPDVIRTAGTANYQAIIRANPGRTEWQLEWRNNSVPTVPSAVIYLTTGKNFDPSTAQLAGRIETKGRYYFDLDPGIPAQGNFKLVVYDFIHGRKLDSIQF